MVSRAVHAGRFFFSPPFRFIPESSGQKALIRKHYHGLGMYEDSFPDWVSVCMDVKQGQTHWTLSLPAPLPSLQYSPESVGGFLFPLSLPSRLFGLLKQKNKEPFSIVHTSLCTLFSHPLLLSLFFSLCSHICNLSLSSVNKDDFLQ